MLFISFIGSQLIVLLGRVEVKLEDELHKVGIDIIIVLIKESSSNFK